MTFTAAATIRQDASEVRSRLHQADPPLSTDEVTVTYLPAPGARGTEVRAVLRQAPTGPLDTVVEAVAGRDPQRELSDAMRRYKQLLETGDVVRSDGSPAGVDAVRTRKQRPAAPVVTEQ